MSPLRALLVVGLLVAAPVAAQTVSPAPLQPPTSQDVPQRPHRFLDRFNAANTSHDGRLTLQQAQAAHMPWVERHFAEIDTQQKGYITVQDVRAYRQQIRASRPDASPSQHVSGQAHRFLDRFNAANTSHDGRLTLQQAQAAPMPWVARNFAAIDTQQKGYITVQDVRTFRQQRQAGRSGID
jgi:hypothetical protein